MLGDRTEIFAREKECLRIHLDALQQVNRIRQTDFAELESDGAGLKHASVAQRIGCSQVRILTADHAGLKKTSRQGSGGFHGQCNGLANRLLRGLARRDRSELEATQRSDIFPTKQ
jgi:hypothetical protein